MLRWSSGDRGNVSLTALDQLLSSGTNFLYAALTAGLLTASGFGAYSVGFSVFLVALGISRAWTSDPLVVLYAASDESDRREATATAARLAASIGVVGGLGLLAAGLLDDSSVAPVLLAFAPVLPVVLVQDCVRIAHVTLGRPGLACLSDGAWLVVSLGGLMALRLADVRSPALAVLFWGAGAGVGLALASAASRSGRARARALREWFHVAAPFSTRYTIEFVLVALSGFVFLVFLAARDSLSDAASVRAAQVAMGPATVAFSASVLVFLPRMTRAGAGVPADVRPLARLQSVSSLGVAAVWLVSVLAVPSALAERVFGASWAGARSLMLWVGLVFLANATTTGPTTMIRALGLARRGLRVRLMTSTIAVAAMVTGFAVGATRGALYAYVGAAWCGAVVWWWAAARDVRRSGGHRPAE